MQKLFLYDLKNRIRDDSVFLCLLFLYLLYEWRKGSEWKSKVNVKFQLYTLPDLSIIF